LVVVWVVVVMGFVAVVAVVVLLVGVEVGMVLVVGGGVIQHDAARLVVEAVGDWMGWVGGWSFIRVPPLVIIVLLVVLLVWTMLMTWGAGKWGIVGFVEVEVGGVAGVVAVAVRFVSNRVGMVVAGVAIGWLVRGISEPTVVGAAVIIVEVALVVVGAKLVATAPATVGGGVVWPSVLVAVVVAGASAHCLCLPGRSLLVCCASVCRSLKSLG
jgi:hypothetical protein